MTETKTQSDGESATAAASWNRIVQATSSEAQAQAVEAFIASVPKPADGRPVSFQLGATDAATGAVSSISNAMARPTQHDVTVRVEGASYRFKPLSDASLTPFMRE